ncbi:MAG: sugar ABC transporter permease [Spirochaetaceae bacterium]|nr:sugar ABC transporter permease [Spirochaetaceae bacterium]
MAHKRSFFRKVEPWLYLLPAILFFFAFTYYPFAKTIFSSFFRVDQMGRWKTFVGWENFMHVLSLDAFHSSVANTIIYTVLDAPISIVIALLFALISSKSTRTSCVYETLFAVTMAMSMSVSAMIFKLAYNPSIGALNAILHTKINWLNDQKWAMIAITAIGVWMHIGYNYIFLLAAVRGIDKSLLESASLDGARFWSRTTKIIMPLISPTLFFLVITSMAKDMMMSSLVLIFTNSASLSTTVNIETMISYMYKQAVNNLNYNDAYATAIIAFIMTFLLMLVSFRYEKKGVFYN